MYSRKENINHIRRIIKVLGHDLTELVVTLDVSGDTLDSIELYEDGFMLNKWYQDLEMGLIDTELCDDEIEYIREQLENLF